MANTRSAKKRVRQIKVRTAHNRTIKSRVKTYRKRIDSVVEEGDLKKAQEELATYFSVVDKAAKTNVIHKNAAARYKSRAAHVVAKLRPKP